MGHNDFIEQIKNKLKDVQSQIDQLQIKAEQANESVRHQWETRKIELKEAQQKLSRQLDELRSGADSQFDELQANAQKSLDKVSQTLKDIKSKLFG